MELETKHEAGDTGDARAAMADFLGAFEAFKDANDERLAALEAKGAADALIEEKVDRINAALDAQKAHVDRLTLAAARPALGADAPARDPQTKAAFSRFMRHGDGAGLIAQQKSVNVTEDTEGGYLAPTETARMIAESVREISPMRAIATVQEIGSNVYRKPISNGDAVAGWVGETAARDTTNAPTITAVDFPTMELYAMPAATQTLLDDAVVDIEEWLAREVQGEFAAQESAAFINGDGQTQPKGIRTYTIVSDAVRAAGEIGDVKTGVDGAFPASNPADILLDLIYTPRQAYRENGRFLMNRSVLGQLRKFRDVDGNYLWQPSTEAGAPARLLGYPVSEAEDMPDIATGSHSIAFGDFRRFYLIVDRAGVRVLRDPYSAKPFVLFYATKRVGGGVQDFDAVKFLTFGS